jgi:hypothetical protein
MATTYKAVVIGCSRMGAFIDNVRPSFPRDRVLPLPSRQLRLVADWPVAGWPH